MSIADRSEQQPSAHRWLAWRVLVADPDHGPLPALLVILTIVTGLVDAVSILRLGRVFVANMTGNVVFSGFALGGAPGFSLSASLVALAGFLVGAAAGGELSGRLGHDRGQLLAVAAGVELALFSVALAVAAVAPQPYRDAGLYTVAALSAVAMGTQNAVARRLAVPDLTTTVLTMTLTGLAADLQGPLRRPTLLRRLLAVAAMVGGAVAGAELVEHASSSAALGAAVGLLVIVTALASLSCRRPASWRQK